MSAQKISGLVSKCVLLIETIIMDRYSHINEEDINKAINKATPENTLKSHKSKWTQFMDFCNNRAYTLTKETPIEELARILKDYAFNMRKKNGSDYKESCVKIIWNCTAKLLQDMYFDQFKIKFDPFKDPEFKEGRKARDAKRKDLQNDLNKRKQSSAAIDGELYIKMIQLWDENTPTGLKRKFFLIVARELAWRGNEAANCRTTYFKEEFDLIGEKRDRIEYNPVFSKTCQGGGAKLSDSKWLTINNEQPEMCPVRLYRKMMEKRPKQILSDRFFLTANPYWNNSNNNEWFKSSPVGKNKIGNWTKESAEKVGIDTKKIKISNHSTRASAVTQLMKTGVNEQEVLKITGHSSANSIKPYLQIDGEHHAQLMQNIRQGNEEISSNLSASSSTNGQIQNYYNCNVYINCYNK